VCRCHVGGVSGAIPCVEGGAGKKKTPDELLGLVWCVEMMGGNGNTQRAFMAHLGMRKDLFFNL
jgi:hypothetical protein